MKQAGGRAKRLVAAASASALVASSFIAFAGTATAEVSPGEGVIINEVYGGGGNSGALIKNDFIELANTTDATVDLDGWSIQYASKAGTSWTNSVDLAGSIEPGKMFLIEAAAGNNAEALPLPTPDVTSTIAMSGKDGNVALVNSVESLNCVAAACAQVDDVVDLVAYGDGLAFAGSGAAPQISNSTSVSRTDFINTADNAADFTLGEPTPTNSAGETVEVPADPDPGPVVERTIAEIQGEGTASPVEGTLAKTTGLVTAAYPTGGFSGFVIQTAGTGVDYDPDTHKASDAIFVFVKGNLSSSIPEIGDNVEATGLVEEFFDLTELTPRTADDIVVLTEDADPVVPITADWPSTDVEREAIESMLFSPGAMTVTNTYSTNQYGEVGLAAGDTPLRQPTDAARPGTPEAAAIEADNNALMVGLDDGATTNFVATGKTPPYISLDNPLRVGANATFNAPVIVDYRNGNWKFNPTSQILPGSEGDVVTFENTRTNGPDQEALGDGALQIAGFNVLNYFTTLGVDVAGCTSYDDREGNGITTNRCPGKGPRGAWDADSLERQQAKVVAAINATDADVTGLMEIENSAVLGEEADEAISTLVDALNADVDSDKWAFVASSSDLPSTDVQDVISNGFIYQPDAVKLVGDAVALGDQSGTGQAFVNAREPIGQVFEPVAGGEKFLAVVNHFKSKGSVGPFPGDADAGDGQANSNGSRKLQAAALKDWVDEVQADKGVEAVALLGDFNSYTQEDPLQILYDAGYVNAVTDFQSTKTSYNYSGQNGSLDHVLLNQAFRNRATGADIWNVNAPESIALEYSRYNSHETLFYEPNAFRSSDHDPVVVGFNSGEAAADGKVDINLLNVNDFHGRIDEDTVKFAGTVEKLRAENEANTLFMAAGDLIGASLFTSSLQQDNPTIDLFNALEMDAAGVGNHEFDKGYDDLVNRVEERANWNYLGANVYDKGTQNPALPEYEIFEIDGVKVGVIGAVTVETPTLVTPGGIADLDFGNPVEAVNRVAAQLSDGDESNGEADIIIAEYHEGAEKGIDDDATLESQVAKSETFAAIVNDTSTEVDVVFTGHTHVPYSWDGPISGSDKTRPVMQAGKYGEYVGQVVLTVDSESMTVDSYTAGLTPRTDDADEDLIAAYPRVAEVKTIVDDAVAEAAVIGDVVIGSITADITTAFSNNKRDDRGSESTLGNLVANSLRDSLAAPETGGAEIGVVNPGGLRADLLYAMEGPETEDGQVRFAEANSVLPFVNNLWTTTLTGEQFKTLLEQQWQTDEAGDVPSRSYLQLGLSDNVSYTFDSDRAQGDHITSITINGDPYDPAAEYRMGTFSFLAQGGDNFRIFRDGADTRDTGLIDRDAWIDYLTENQDLAPDFARHAVEVVGNPEVAEVGSDVSFEVSGLDLTSLGSPANTTLKGTLHGPDLPVEGVDVGSFDVADGAATVAFAVPAAAASATSLVLVADPSGTTVHLPFAVGAGGGGQAVETTTTLKVTGKFKVGKAITMSATVEPADAQGVVEFRSGDLLLGTVRVGNGFAGIVTQALEAGKHSLTATFVPDDTDAFAGSVSKAKQIKVKAPPKSKVWVTGELSSKKVDFDKPATVSVTVRGKKAAPSGTVQIRDRGDVIASGDLSVDGKTGTVTIQLPQMSPGKYKLSAHYLGSDTTKAGKANLGEYKVNKVVKSKVSMFAYVTRPITSTDRPGSVQVSVRGATAVPDGVVEIRNGNDVVASGTLDVNGRAGTAKIKLPKMKRGQYRMTAHYLGSDTTEAAEMRLTTYTVVNWWPF